MCMMCDGMSKRQVTAWVRDTILTNGWALMHVEGADARNPAFAYTIGLSRYAHPELIVFGAHPTCNARALNTIGAVVAEGRRLVEGDTVDDLFAPPDEGSLVLEFPDSSTHLLLANQMYRAAGAPPLPALQVLFCGLDEDS